jgi:hypothetical protein
VGGQARQTAWLHLCFCLTVVAPLPQSQSASKLAGERVQGQQLFGWLNQTQQT